MSRATTLLLLSLLLVSCGGGGGGGTGSTAPTDQPLSYVGSMGPAAIDRSNGEDAMRGVLLTMSLPARIAAVADTFLTLSGSINQTIAGPNGGSAHLSGSINTGTGTVSARFDHYQNAGGEIDGDLKVEVIHAADASHPQSIRISITRLTSNTSGSSADNATVSGTISRDRDATSETLTANFVVRDDGTGNMSWLDNVVVHRELDLFLPIRVLETVSGQLFLSTQGYWKLSSDGQLVLRSLDDALAPYAGGLLKAEGLSSSIWLRPINATYAALLFDDNNDKLADVSRRVSWDALLAGSVPPAPGGNRPQPNAVSPPAVQVGTTITPDALASVDADDEWLTYEWRIELTPAGSTAALTDAATPLPKFTPDVPGDYLLSVRISDGVNSVYDSARITATVDQHAAPTTIAALERPPDSAPGTPVVFDATASYGLPYDTTNYTYYWSILDSGPGMRPLGQSTDGRWTWTPGSPGTYTVSVDVCYTGGDCADRVERIVTIGPAPRYFQPAKLSNGSVLSSPLVADFDHNGQPDIALRSTPNQFPATFSLDVMLRGAAGTYVNKHIAVPADGRLLSGDLNGDGAADLVVRGNDSIYVIRGQSDGTFAVETSAIPPCSPGQYLADILAIADANGDGRADLFQYDFCGAWLQVRLQTATGSLAAPVSVFAPTNSAVPTVGDVNGDGRADLLWASIAPAQTSTHLHVYLAQPDGSYVLSQDLPAPDVTLSVLTIADFTGDGLPDVLAIGRNSIFVFRQLPDHTLADAVAYSSGGPTLYGDSIGGAADYNNDGRVDFFTDGVMFLQTEQGTLEALPVTGAFPNPYIAAADLNGDGLTDVLNMTIGFPSPQNPVVYLARPADSP